LTNNIAFYIAAKFCFEVWRIQVIQALSAASAGGRQSVPLYLRQQQGNRITDTPICWWGGLSSKNLSWLFQIMFEPVQVSRLCFAAPRLNLRGRLKLKLNTKFSHSS
jgi:hypothetical protein